MMLKERQMPHVLTSKQPKAVDFIEVKSTRRLLELGKCVWEKGIERGQLLGINYS
jgi:hypothetical protein